MAHPPRLEFQLLSPRLCLRPYTPEDLPKIFAFTSNPQVVRFMSWNIHRTLKDTQVWLAQSVKPFQTGPEGPLVLELRGTQELVGAAWVSWDSPGVTMGQLGYVLDEPFWGKGFAKEACEAMVDNAFTTHSSLVRLQAYVRLENAASSKVLEKINFKREGLVRALPVPSGNWDVYLYSMLRQEWEDSSPRLMGFERGLRGFDNRPHA